MFKNKYRIVTDEYAGYEVQIKRWWFPFYRMVGVNTFNSIERATKFAKTHSKRHVVVQLDM